MLENSVQVIKAVLQGDPTVSQVERREYLHLLVHGKPATPAPAASDGPRILRRREVAARLGRTLRSVDALCAEGILIKRIFPGRKRAAGILESSLTAAISAT